MAIRSQSVSIIPNEYYVVRKHPASSTSKDYATRKHADDYIKAVSECIALLNNSVISNAGVAKYYYARYAVNRFLEYFYKRVPSRYRGVFLRGFVDEMHCLGEYPILFNWDKLLTFCKKKNVFTHSRYVLFRLLVFYMKRIRH